MRQAVQHLKENHLKDAIRLFEKIAEEYPLDFKVISGLSKLVLFQNSKTFAIESNASFEAVQDVNKHDALLKNTFAAYYLGNYKEVIK